jgi:hypothetical protein
MLQIVFHLIHLGERATDWNFSLLTLNLPSNRTISGRAHHAVSGFTSLYFHLSLVNPQTRVILKSCGNNRLFYIRLLASILLHIFAFSIDKLSIHGENKRERSSEKMANSPWNQQELKSHSG